jgi:hypothetical protein
MRPLMHLLPPRRIASAMLLVWLFAVFASWANACLVRPGAQSGAYPTASRGFHGHADAGVRHGDPHRHADVAPTKGAGSAQEVCAEFCEAEQRIVAKPQPSKGDGAADPLLFLPTALSGWPAFLPGRLDPRWRPLAAPPPPAAPVAIAFLRLTL